MAAAGAYRTLNPGLRRYAGQAELGERKNVRVLVADDERLLADTVADGLRRLVDGRRRLLRRRGAIERVGVNRYDVAVLDRDMPGRTGDEVCR